MPEKFETGSISLDTLVGVQLFGSALWHGRKAFPRFMVRDVHGEDILAEDIKYYLDKLETPEAVLQEGMNISVSDICFDWNDLFRYQIIVYFLVTRKAIHGQSLNRTSPIAQNADVCARSAFFNLFFECAQTIRNPTIDTGNGLWSVEKGVFFTLLAHALPATSPNRVGAPRGPRYEDHRGLAANEAWQLMIAETYSRSAAVKEILIGYEILPVGQAPSRPYYIFAQDEERAYRLVLAALNEILDRDESA